MTSALVLGIDPHVLPGPEADAVRAALDNESARFGAQGIEVSTTLVALDDSAEPEIVAALSKRAWDVVVVVGGIRKPAPLLTFFERVVNLIRQHAPQAAIAFDTSVGDSVESVRRVL
jgi:CO dehydrogenase/acetyl-CoA synthase epsilon subunit